MADESKKKKGFRIGFRGKVLGLTLPFMIVMIIVLIAIAYIVSRNNIMESSERLLTTSAKDQSHQIESWMNRSLAQCFHQ